MAGYYDPNMDYSKELQRTDLSADERDRLTRERQNKITEKYGGEEPVMTGSNKTYTQTYGGASAGKSGGSSGGYKTGVYGSAILDSDPSRQGTTNADMSRRPDLAGKTAVSNGYTVYYDQNGYARKAVKGVTDYLPNRDINAANGSYNTSGAWTDNEMLSAADLASIQNIRNQLNSGQLTAAQANQRANQIRSNYGYTIDTAGNVYDSGEGAAVAARRQQMGLDTGAMTDAQQQYLKLMFPEQNTEDPSAMLNALYALQQGTYNPDTQYTGSGMLSGSGSYTSGGGYGDMTDYINALYAQQLEAELAALKSAYDSNVAEVEAQNDKIAEQYRTARNQAAAQNALESQRMNEMGIAQGLNTGATGQMALAQNAAYQNSLGDLWAQEAQDQADVDLMLAQLLNQYNGSVQQTTAQSNAQRTQALLEEMLRQQELAAQQQSTTKPTLTWAQVKKELEDGNTSPAVLAGYEYYMGQAYPTDANAALTPGTPVKNPGGGYNNGGLTVDQVKQLQTYYGVTPDGKWGNNSKNAAGGLSADEAWAAYDAPGYNASNFNAAMSSIRTALDQGKTDTLYGGISSMWGKLSAAQQNTVQQLLAEYGLAY